MANLNKVMIIGNLTADPELRTTPNGHQVCELRLAVNRVSGGQNGTERREETTFLDATCWGRTAEVASNYLAKGRPVFIEGRLQMDSWEDKATGQKRSRIRIIVENMQLLGSRDGGGNGGGANSNSGGNDGGGYQQRKSYSSGQNNNYSGGGAPRSNNFSAAGNNAPSQSPSVSMEDDDDIPF